MSRSSSQAWAPSTAALRRMPAGKRPHGRNTPKRKAFLGPHATCVLQWGATQHPAWGEIGVPSMPPRKPAAPGHGERPGFSGMGVSLWQSPASMLPNSIAPKAGLARVPAEPRVTSPCFTFSQSPPVGGRLLPRLWLGFRVGRDTQKKPQLLRAFHLQEPRRPCQAALPSLAPPLPGERLAETRLPLHAPESGHSCPGDLRLNPEGPGPGPPCICVLESSRRSARQWVEEV